MLGRPIQAWTAAEQSKGTLRYYDLDFHKRLAAFFTAYIMRHCQKLDT